MWDEMTVTWTSGYGITEAEPFVEWSKIGGDQRHSAAGTLTFDRRSMCGAPARTVGWRDPGYVHTSFLKDLWPNKLFKDALQATNQIFVIIYISRCSQLPNATVYTKGVYSCPFFKESIIEVEVDSIWTPLNAWAVLSVDGSNFNCGSPTTDCDRIYNYSGNKRHI